MLRGVQEMANARVYVGIPESKTSRPGAITNAGLMYIHTHGSEVMNIPPRPVIEPALEADMAVLENILGEGVKAGLNGDMNGVKQNLQIAGQRGANDAQQWFTNPDNGWPQNSPATIARKLAKIRNKKTRNDALSVLAAASFMPTYGDNPDLDAINTPLIDTGSLRKSITFVVDMQAEKNA
jgi:hypothetical protein